MINCQWGACQQTGKEGPREGFQQTGKGLREGIGEERLSEGLRE